MAEHNYTKRQSDGQDHSDHTHTHTFLKNKNSEHPLLLNSEKQKSCGNTGLGEDRKDS